MKVFTEVKEKPLEITWDHKGFYLREKPFIFNEKNFSCITLPADLDKTLDWEKEVLEAEKIISQNKMILWHLDLGLENSKFAFDDELAFKSRSLAIEKFSKEIWSKKFQKNSLGVLLYKNSLNVEKSFVWSHKLKDHYFDRLKEKNVLDTFHEKRLFCLEVLIDNIRLFSYQFPDMLPIFLGFDVSEMNSNAEIAQLLSKERFEHFVLAVSGGKIPFSPITWEEETFQASDQDEITVGVCLPSDLACIPSILKNLDQIFDDLSEKKKKFRILSEMYMTEDWEGLDTIIAIEKSLSEQGKRMLQGFSAAGGKIQNF